MKQDLRRRASDKGLHNQEAVWQAGEWQERTVAGKSSEDSKSFCMVVGFIILLLGIMGAGSIVLTKQMGETKGQFQRWFEETEETIFNNTRAEIRQFRGDKTMPTFGLTSGRYHDMAGTYCDNCAARLRSLCGFEVVNASRPPLELIVPGRLSDRPSLSQRSQCFLWYANTIWTRPSGGKNGFLITRLGAGIDNRTWMLEALHAYEAKHKCPSYAFYPPTLDLGNKGQCEDFFVSNGKWAASLDALWFIKAADGSTGRHISLMRRRDVERLLQLHKSLSLLRDTHPNSLPPTPPPQPLVRGGQGAGAGAGRGGGQGEGGGGWGVCPMAGGVASLEVRSMYTIGNKKFDNRIFVLVASIKPFVVLFHPGHLRLSFFNYSDGGSESPHTPDTPHTPAPETSATENGELGRHEEGEGRGKVTQELGPSARVAWGGSEGSLSEGTGARLRRVHLGGGGVHVGGGRRPEEDEELARHITNPRFGFAHTNDSDLLLQPLKTLGLALKATHGPAAADALFRHSQMSVRRAALLTLHAIKSKLTDRDYHSRWGFALIAMDVAYDADMNAFILDVNSGPSFYHEHAFPPWFLLQRSAIVREALDVVQEMAFYKVAQKNATQRLPRVKEWQVLYHELAGGVVAADMPPDGSCR